MIRGLYTAASGMLALQRRQETLANNLANINTAGFKEDEGVIRSFPEQLISRIRDKQAPDIQGWPSIPGQPVVIGTLHTGAYMSEALPNFAQGDIEQTDQPYDVALTDNLPVDPNTPFTVNDKPVQPRLFFSVARITDPQQLTQPVDPANIRYTRNGNWSVNSEGYLVTSSGYYVLDQANQPIKLNGRTGPNGELLDAGRGVKITSSGEILIPDPNGPEGTYLPNDPTAPLRLGLKVVNNPYQLVREGNDVYRWAGDGQPADVDNDPELSRYYTLRQGWLERSNVDATRTMTDMMTVLRAYEANQRVITTLDQTMDKAANEIGRVNG